MADAEPRLNPPLPAVEALGPGGKEAADEIARAIEDAMPRAGGKIRLFFKTVGVAPTPRPDGVIVYSWDNAGTIELRAIQPDGTITTLVP